MTKPPTDEAVDQPDLGDIPEAHHAGRGVRGKYYRDPYDPALPDRPIRRVVDGQVYYTPARRRVPDQRRELRRLREALERIAALADAEEPRSVRAGQIARDALKRPVTS